MAAIRVLLAEDDPLAQQAIETYLSKPQDLSLVGIAPDGEQAIAMAQELSPDVAIVDIHMPKLNGLEVTKALVPTGVKVLCFTALGDDQILRRALLAGASGFLLKSDSPGIVLHGVRSTYSGDSLVSPKLVAALLRASGPRSTPPAHVTDKDQQLMALIGRGLSNAEIAERLFLAPNTVKTYVSRLLSQHNRPNRAALAALAFEWGLVDPN